jgi:hypothetical protein
MGAFLFFGLSAAGAEVQNLLKMGAPFSVPGGQILLESVDLPQKSVPGNRPLYKLIFIAADGNRRPFKLDAFDSGKTFHFNKAEFKLWTDPADPKTLRVEVSEGKAE